MKIINKHKDAISREAILALQAFTTLLQEGENHEYISNKMMDAVARRIEAKLEMALEGGLGKMGEIVEKVVANQNELQAATSTLAEKTVTLQKLA